MKEDTKQILDNMERDLMKEALREEQESGPAFDDPDVLETGPEPEVYSNFANDYGKELTRLAESELPEEKEDNVTTILMLIACILSLSIICVMLYWLRAWR